jgi:uncharacterized protein YidB (DUF937 family)
MGLLDEVISMASASGNVQGVQPAQHASALSAIMDYVNSPQVGGIAGLQKMFQQGGLGSIFSSWISSGQNLPVSASELQNVLHSGALQAAAQKAGIDPSQLTGAMSSLLPHLIDKLTPNGQVPDPASLQNILKGFTSGQPA